MPKMTTIHDVAHRAGVSVATVSRVMNGTAYVSDELRDRVWEAIRELNYSPSALARGLSTHVSRTIGVCIPSITKHPFWALVVTGIEGVCHRERYNIFLCNTDTNPQRERDYIELLRTRRVDGIVIGPSSDSVSHLKPFMDPNWPVVMVDRKFLDLEVPAVLVDNYHASLAAMEYLIRLGHRRIGVVAGPHSHTVASDRIRGYRDALARSGIPMDEALIRMRSYEDEHAHEATRALLALPNPPTAILSCSGRLAKGILSVIQGEGLQIPQDISLLTFDDLDWMSLVTPPLTAIAQPASEMGERAMEILLRILQGEETLGAREVVLKTEFVERASCGPAPQAVLADQSEAKTLTAVSRAGEA